MPDEKENVKEPELPPSRRALEIEVEDLKKENRRIRADLDRLMTEPLGPDDPDADVPSDDGADDDDGDGFSVEELLGE